MGKQYQYIQSIDTAAYNSVLWPKSCLAILVYTCTMHYTTSFCCIAKVQLQNSASLLIYQLIIGCTHIIHKLTSMDTLLVLYVNVY